MKTQAIVFFWNRIVMKLSYKSVSFLTLPFVSQVYNLARKPLGYQKQRRKYSLFFIQIKCIRGAFSAIIRFFVEI